MRQRERERERSNKRRERKRKCKRDREAGSEGIKGRHGIFKRICFSL